MAETISTRIEANAGDAHCGPLSAQVVNAMSLLQEKWALFIVHALLSGPIGFNDMSRAAGRVNSTTLAQRLVLLEQAGVVTKTVQSTMPPRTSYELTEAGWALRAVITAIVAWGERYMPDQPANWSDRTMPDQSGCAT